MKCPRCGADNAPENSYCLICGAQFEKTEPEKAMPANNPEVKDDKVGGLIEKLKKKKPGKKALALLALAVLVVIAVAVVAVAVMSGGSRYDMIKSVVAPMGGSDGTFIMNGTAVTKLDDELNSEIDGLIKSVEYSMDRQTFVLGLTNGDVYVNNKEGGLDKILDEVDKFTLSGSTVAYMDTEGALYVYSLKNGKKTKVADEVNTASGITVSPDGKYVAYNVTDKNGDDDLYVYNGKKSVEIDDALIAIAISNKGKYIYCYNSDKDGLYVYDMKGESIKLSVGVGGTFVFNRDCTEMIFTASDGDCYISIKGGDKQKLGAGMLIPIVPASAQTASFMQTVSWYSGTFTAVRYGVDTITEMFCYNNFAGTIVYLNGNMETERVASSVEYGSAKLSDDGKTLYFLRDDTLCRVKESDIDNLDEIAEEVDTFAIATNGKSAYFIDDGDTLWYAKGTGKPKRIADDIISVAVSHDGYAFFIGEYSYTSNSGVLYACKNGGKKSQVLDDVYCMGSGKNIVTTASATYCYGGYNPNNGSVDLYTAGNKTEFTLIIEGVK